MKLADFAGRVRFVLFRLMDLLQSLDAEFTPEEVSHSFERSDLPDEWISRRTVVPVARLAFRGRRNAGGRAAKN